MKNSRDLARQELNDPQFDMVITEEMTLIKNTGANYVAIGTPYDDKFLPFLTRWVNAARSQGLHVWFRGNWSSWEGWFDYPKNMTPDEHIASTSAFITTHPNLFQDGDIFEGCPECENAGFWPEPVGNANYNAFLMQQRQTNQRAFNTIKKQVFTNTSSITGGKARDILTQQTIDALNKTVSIDHYIASASSMTDYINYFSNNFHAKVLVSEFGAPIPDINGAMTEDQQAQFVNTVLEQLSKQKNNVLGVNYFTLTDGTTSLLNDDGTKRKVYDVVKNYFSHVEAGGTTNNVEKGVLQAISHHITISSCIVKNAMVSAYIIITAGQTEIKQNLLINPPQADSDDHTQNCIP